MNEQFWVARVNVSGFHNKNKVRRTKYLYDLL